jgi:hypothetical protein
LKTLPTRQLFNSALEYLKNNKPQKYDDKLRELQNASTVIPGINFFSQGRTEDMTWAPPVLKALELLEYMSLQYPDAFSTKIDNVKQLELDYEQFNITFQKILSQVKKITENSQKVEQSNSLMRTEEVSAERSTAVVHYPTGVIAGNYHNITVEVRGIFGNLMNNLCEFPFEINSISDNGAKLTTTTTESKKGTFLVKVHCDTPCVATVSIKKNNVLIGNRSPIVLKFQPEAMNPEQSLVTISNCEQITVNEPVLIQVEARNNIGREIKTGGEKIALRLEGTNFSCPYEVQDHNNGLYTLKFIPQFSGDTVIRVLCNNITIGDPISIIVQEKKEKTLNILISGYKSLQNLKELMSEGGLKYGVRYNFIEEGKAKPDIILHFVLVSSSPNFADEKHYMDSLMSKTESGSSIHIVLVPLYKGQEKPAFYWGSQEKLPKDYKSGVNLKQGAKGPKIEKVLYLCIHNQRIVLDYYREQNQEQLQLLHELTSKVAK